MEASDVLRLVARNGRNGQSTGPQPTTTGVSNVRLGGCIWNQPHAPYMAARNRPALATAS